MKHLDERVSDLIDDRLDHDERDRALGHLTVCTQCRDAVEYERNAKNALRGLPDAEPSGTLVQNLLALAEPGEPLPPEPPARTSSPAPVARWQSRESRSASAPSTRRPATRTRTRGRSRAIRGVALGMCGTGALLVGLASLGSPNSTSEPSPTPASVVPPLEDFTLEHARSTGGLPFVEPGSLLIGDSEPAGDGW